MRANSTESTNIHDLLGKKLLVEILWLHGFVVIARK